MKVLVTGGLGCIGSHTAVELSKKFKTIIVDNLINSNISVIDGINKLSWKPNYSLADALLSAWKWEKKIRKI